MDPALYLGAALAPLPLAPALDRAVRRWPVARPALDGFVLTLVGLLVLLHLFPHALAEAGPWAFVTLAVGLLVPSVLEAGATRRGGLLALVGVGLCAHVLLDGAALGALDRPGAEHGRHGALAWAVVVHRLPISLLIWWLVVPKWGRRAGVIALVAVAALTVAGYAAGARAARWAEAGQFALFEAFVGGVLLHVLASPQRAPAGQASRGGAVAELAGAGLALVIFVWSHHVGALAHEGQSFASSLGAVVLATAPAVAVGFGLVVAVQARPAGCAGRTTLGDVTAALAPSVLAGGLAEAFLRQAGVATLPTGIALAGAILGAGIVRHARRSDVRWGPAATLGATVALGAALPLPPAPVAWVAVGALAAGFAPVMVRIGPRALVLGRRAPSGPE